MKETRGDLRAVFLGLVALSTSVGAGFFHLVLAEDGVQPIDVALLAVFTVLFLWICASFWAAAFGALALLRRGRAGAVAAEPSAPADEEPLPRTAVLLPVFNESPTRLAATVRAIRSSLAATGRGGSFDFFVLSDTTDPETWIEEELVWAEIAAAPDGGGVHYRRRSSNRGRKSGNVADWCARWGAAYRYMLILDADSLMEGATIVEMVRRMERDPRLAILQTPPRLVNQGGFFARAQQLASSVYGPMHAAGLAALSGGDAGSSGHNALVRVEAYARHCGLPALPGARPFGGEIVDPDFVEAALLRRAGYSARLAEDLDGSYEEVPSTLEDFARRDERRCQGILQHVRLMLSPGFHPASRVHFGTGAMAYLASPLWLAFVGLGVVAAARLTGRSGLTETGATRAVALFVVTVGMLLAPRIWALLLLVRDRTRVATHGGVLRAAASVAVEMLASILIVPTLTLLRSQFIVDALLGRSVRWTTQRRDADGPTFAEAARTHGGHTLAGLGATGVVALVAPGLLPWLSPLLLGLVLSIPISVALGSLRVGGALRHAGLLLTSEETRAPPVVRRFREELVAAAARRAARGYGGLFERALFDPVLHAIHVDLVRASPPLRPPSKPQLRRIERIAFGRGPSRLAPSDRLALLGDLALLRRIHLAARAT